jgi:hypothetical protein
MRWTWIRAGYEVCESAHCTEIFAKIEQAFGRQTEEFKRFFKTPAVFAQEGPFGIFIIAGLANCFP